MTITISPLIIKLNRTHEPLPILQDNEEHIKSEHLQVTYWGIYLDGKYISYTSSKERAEKTKLWMEKWLKDRQ